MRKLPLSLCRIILAFLLLLLSNRIVNAQFIPVFVFYEDSLKKLGPLILNGKDDFIKYNANDRFLTLLKEALEINNSFDYPFDSLITISRLEAPDHSFRIFTWNLPKSDGTYEHFGFIQSYNKRRKKYQVFELDDHSDELKDYEHQTLYPDNWFGAHYYKMIYTHNKKKKYYTLLGWDGNNATSDKKIVDVLTFRSNGSPVFGASIFKNYGKKLKRVVFEYSQKASMLLNYDNQQYYVAKKKRFIFRKKKKKNDVKIKKIKSGMIVFDYLMPLDESLKGRYEYYVPSVEFVDAFVWIDGKWQYIHDVDARNPEKPINFIPPNKRPPQKDFYKPLK